MAGYLLRRLGVAVLVALTVSLITFSMIYLSGDPAVALAGEAATEADIQAIRAYTATTGPSSCSISTGCGARCRAISASPTISGSRWPT